MALQDRLKERLAVLGISQAELARRVGISQATVGKLAVGIAGGSKHLHRIARELQTTPAYLTGEIDDPSAGALPVPTSESAAEQLNSVLVPLYRNMPLSMGHGAIVEHEPASEMIPFARDWLRGRISGTPNDLILMPGEGESMEPTIRDGDVMLIDRAQRVVTKPYKIWAFEFQGTGYIKRLRPLDGKKRLEATSDNPVIPPFQGDASDFHVLGRIVSIMRWQ